MYCDLVVFENLTIYRNWPRWAPWQGSTNGMTSRGREGSAALVSSDQSTGGLMLSVCPF